MTSKNLQTKSFETPQRPSRAEAEKAVEVLLRWAGDDPLREGLLDTPGRVVRAYEEFFAGYGRDAKEELARTFEDIQGFDEMVIVKNIDFTSHCEHHMVPITGIAHVAYWPNEKIVGISKLARIVDIYSKRLVSQETLTLQIVQAIDEALSPKGAAVLIEAAHECMSTRGVNKQHSLTVTSMFSGIFKTDPDVQRRFMDLSRS